MKRYRKHQLLLITRVISTLVQVLLFFHVVNGHIGAHCTLYVHCSKIEITC